MRYQADARVVARPGDAFASPNNDATGNGSLSVSRSIALRIPFTIFSTRDGSPCSKSYERGSDGGLVKKVAAKLGSGVYSTKYVSTVTELADVIRGLTTSDVVSWGVPVGLPSGIVTTKAKIEAGEAPAGAIARSRESFCWHDGPGILMLDMDLGDLAGRLPALERLAEVADDLAVAHLREVLCNAVPELASAPMLALPSASSNLYNPETDISDTGLRGLRVLVPVTHAPDIPQIGTRIFQRLIVRGLGCAKVGRAGQVTISSLIDPLVWQPERLDFIAGAHCGKGVKQRAREPQLFNAAAAPLSLGAMRGFSSEEERSYSRIVSELRRDAEEESQAAREQWMRERLAQGLGTDARALPSTSSSARVNPATGAASGYDLPWVLGGSHPIVLSNGERVTVSEILRAPEYFHEHTCRDPLEPEYNDDDRVARIFTVGQTAGPKIRSFAHGGALFFLTLDAADEFEPIESAEHALVDALPTDMGNADRFAQKFGSVLRYVPELDAWRLWDGRRWARAHDVDLMRLAKENARELHRLAMALPPEERKTWLRWAERSQSAQRLSAAHSTARDLMITPLRDFDRDPMLLNVANGTIDLCTGGLLPHDQGRMLSQISEVAYDPDAKAPRWEQFIATTFQHDEQMIAYAQRVVGYCLTGSVDEQVMFMLHGTGANGKSVFVETLRILFGEYARQSNYGIVQVRRDSDVDKPRPSISRLERGRLVTANESDPKKLLDEAMVKMLTGGDTLATRTLYQEEREIQPTHKLMLSANQRPTIDTNDYAIWRRIHLIPFLYTVPEAERDPKLREALELELPGILAWGVEGCLAWQREGLNPPRAVLDAVSDYRRETDVLARFIDECCELTPNAPLIKSSELYEYFKRWCISDGVPVCSVVEFGKMLVRYDPSKVNRPKGNAKPWRGIAVDAAKCVALGIPVSLV